jgi:hypothetical protein
MNLHVGRLVRTFVAVFAFASTSLLAGAPAGCGSDGEGTTGRRVALTLRATGSAGARAPFTTAAGWNVSLSKALIATGEMTFWDGATIFSYARPRGVSLVGGVAFAHPGHYVAGQAKGDVRVSSSLDLRAGEVVLGAGAGVSGIVRSATFAFGSPAVGPFAGELGANVVVLEGTATKGTESRSFRAEVTAAEVRDAKGLPQVEGCAFAETDVASDGVVTVTVKVEPWLDQVDFTEVAPSADGKPVVVAAGTVARNAVLRGIKAGTPYVFAFAPSR